MQLSGGRVFQLEGTVTTKALRQECAHPIWGKVRLSGHLEQSERGGRR